MLVLDSHRSHMDVSVLNVAKLTHYPTFLLIGVKNSVSGENFSGDNIWAAPLLTTHTMERKIVKRKLVNVRATSLN